ncbi:MAG: hypothetical protein LBB83_09705 [Treponema sp.]|jgi:hypothetical protein|nr:hypothetical protein [Treponema sp.]
MSLFCLFWTPLVLLLWVSLNSGSRGGSDGILAFVLGSLVSVLHYFFYPIINTAGFGFFLWLFALINIVLIPAVLPFLFFILLALSGFFKDKADPVKFVLFALVPAGVIRAIGWSAHNDPLYLVLIPVLWTTLALGISFLWRRARESSFPRIIFFLLAIFLMPPTAAAVFWAFYGQMVPAGFILLAALSIPSIIAFAAACFNLGRGPRINM